MSKSLIKEAQQNAINQSKAIMDCLQFIDALKTFAYRYMSDSRNPRAQKSIQELRDIIYDQFVENLSRCFLFVGVGGEEAEEFSREMFVEYFGDNRFAVMQFLDKFGHFPRSWDGTEEKQFRVELEEKVREIKNHEI